MPQRERYAEYLKSYEAVCREDGIDIVLTECSKERWTIEYYPNETDLYDRSLEIYGILCTYAGALNVMYTGSGIKRGAKAVYIWLTPDFSKRIFNEE